MLKTTNFLREKAKEAILELEKSGAQEQDIDDPKGFLVTVGLMKDKPYMPVDMIEVNGVKYTICHRI